MGASNSLVIADNRLTFTVACPACHVAIPTFSIAPEDGPHKIVFCPTCSSATIAVSNSKTGKDLQALATQALAAEGETVASTMLVLSASIGVGKAPIGLAWYQKKQSVR